MTIRTPAEAVLAYEPLTNHGTGGHVLFADGSVRWLGVAELTKLIPALNAGHNPPGLPAD